MTMLGRLSLLTAKRVLTGFALSALTAGVCALPAQARVVGSSDLVANAAGPVQYSFANTDGYRVNEDVGNYPMVIDRDDASGPGVICWGVTNQTDEAGSNFTKIDHQQVAFAADPSNVLGYAPPTDGDPLQNVDWYIFGDQLAPGKTAARYEQSNPAWAKAFDVLAPSPIRRCS